MHKDLATPGERLRWIREDRGYTRDYISEKSDISSKFLFEIETNRKGFSADTLMKLSATLETNMEYIMTGEIPFKCEDKIAAVLERFKPCTLEKIERMLIIAYELTSGK